MEERRAGFHLESFQTAEELSNYVNRNMISQKDVVNVIIDNGVYFLAYYR